MDGSQETLQKQFSSLQLQQQRKLTRIKERQDKKKKEKSALSAERTSSQAFGVDDDLGLKLADPPSNGSIYSEELVNHLNDQLREMKDETGRLYKLLSERDLELRQLKKRGEREKELMQQGVSNETAATKIVELSKKIRELTAEVESERTKSRQLARKCGELEKRIANSDGKVEPSNGSIVSLESIQTDGALGEKMTAQDIKGLQEKLRQTEMKLSEQRNQNQLLRQEIKMAHKVLSQEVGENVNLQSMLSGSAGWRGRSQQIISLQKKVNDLKGQLSEHQSKSKALDIDLEDEFMGSATYRKQNVDDRGREKIRKMEKDRKEMMEKMQTDAKALEKDYESLKNKTDASKARNKVLSNELKMAKQQIATLLEKGRHDDELIQALFKQQEQLKVSMDEASKIKQESDIDKEKSMQKKTSQAQQENNIVEQLKSIVSEKEKKVKMLEQEIEQLQLTNLQKAQLSGVNDLFERTSRQSTPCDRPTSVIAEVLEEYVASPSPAPQSSRLSRPMSKSTMRSNSQASGVDGDMLEELRLQCQEYKSISQAATVERDKLAELVGVLEQRIAEATLQSADLQNDLVAERRKSVELEKRLGKAKVEQSQSAKKTKGKTSASTVSLRDALASENSLQSNVEELEVRLAIQKDENEAIKAALQSTLKAKQEDLKLYNEMMEQTKKVFLEGLRQFRSQNSC